MDVGQFKDFAQLFSIRRNVKDKKLFRENLRQLFHSFHYEGTEYNEQIGIRKITHLVFGDLHQASYVFVAGYDTAENYLIGNGVHYPFYEDRNRAREFINLTFSLLLSLLVAALGIYLFYRALSLNIYRKIVMMLAGLIVIIIANKLSRGLTNRATFSKTASIFALFELLKKTGHQDKLAYIFLDMGSYSKIGLHFLKTEGLIRKDQTLIYLDYFGDGDLLAVGSDAKAKAFAEKIRKQYKDPSVYVDLSACGANRFDDLEKIVVLSLVKQDDKEQYYIEHVRTDDDLTIVPEMIDKTVEALGKVI
ncbi:MAG: hypothetical protein IKS69_05885 [Erysipelotrichaceae bacterium]|nr:hypothetical protein [Erysipelotrichaceae bacterium]